SEFVLGARIEGHEPAFLEIAPLCSGYEGLGLLWIILGISFWASRHHLSFSAALFLTAVASLFMWCAILLRLFGLVLIALSSAELAMSAAHSQLSWVIFNI